MEFMKTNGSISGIASANELDTKNILAVTTDEEVATTIGVGKQFKHSQRQWVPCMLILDQN